MKRTSHHPKSLGEVPKAFAEKFTCDHFWVNGDEKLGPDLNLHPDCKGAMVPLDRATDFGDAFATHTRNTESVKHAWLKFVGDENIRPFGYSDGAKEFVRAAMDLEWAHESATPGVHENNAVAERYVRFVINKNPFCSISGLISSRYV